MVLVEGLLAVATPAGKARAPTTSSETLENHHGIINMIFI